MKSCRALVQATAISGRRVDVGAFRRKGGGVLAASLETDQPRGRLGRQWYRIKRALIGKPLSTEQSIHERLTNVKALAVLSSDALSSVAYATEEIVRVLILATVAGGLGLPCHRFCGHDAAGYRGGFLPADDCGLTHAAAAPTYCQGQPRHAAGSHCSGFHLDRLHDDRGCEYHGRRGGSYSIFPNLQSVRVEICVGIVILVTVANLRGVREAGNIFAVPTYLFVIGILGMIGYGLVRIYLGVGGQLVYVPPPQVIPAGAEGITLFLLLRAFTQGCTALTGVEAIADGVPAFKPPEAKNARTTLVWMAVLAISMFFGITLLASQIKLEPSDQETVLSQLARTILPSFGDVPVLWFYIQIATALILVLAANTAFSDFPRLGYFLARDKFMPHQYSFRGDRLAYSWGIVTLAVLACILLIAFNGDTTALIPLYTVGVFNSFTLSQAGMVKRWWKLRTPRWQYNMAVNLLGAIATGVVLIISAATKFLLGAWIVIVLIPILIAMFLAINRHYRRVAAEVTRS